MNTPLDENSEERLEWVLNGLRSRTIPTFPNAKINFPVEPTPSILRGLSSRRLPAVVQRIAVSSLLCAAFGFILFNIRGGGASVVLGDVIQSVVQKKSVSFVMKELINGETAKTFHCWMQEGCLRIEGAGDTILIENGTSSIWLELKNKRVLTSTAVRKDSVPNPIEKLRQAKSDRARFVGKEDIDRRHTNRFQMPIQDVSLFQDGEQYGFGADLELTTWIDVETQLPLRIEIRHPNGGARIIFEQLKWNEELDESLFDTQIPHGFTK